MTGSTDFDEPVALLTLAANTVFMRLRLHGLAHALLSRAN
jgi:hypothetical protein